MVCLACEQTLGGMEGRNQLIGMFTGDVLCQKLIKMAKFCQIEIFECMNIENKIRGIFTCWVPSV